MICTNCGEMISDKTAMCPYCRWSTGVKSLVGTVDKDEHGFENPRKVVIEDMIVVNRVGEEVHKLQVATKGKNLFYPLDMLYARYKDYRYGASDYIGILICIVISILLCKSWMLLVSLPLLLIWKVSSYLYIHYIKLKSRKHKLYHTLSGLFSSLWVGSVFIGVWLFILSIMYNY